MRNEAAESFDTTYIHGDEFIVVTIGSRHLNKVRQERSCRVGQNLSQSHLQARSVVAGFSVKEVGQGFCHAQLLLTIDWS